MSYYGEDAEILALSDEKGYDPRTGATLTKKWRCSPTGAATKELELILSGVRCDVGEEDEQGWIIVRAYYGGGETQDPSTPLADIWTLQGNDIEKSLWQLPKVQTELNKFTEVWQAVALKSDIEALLAGESSTINREPDGTGTDEADLSLSYILTGAENAGLNATVIQGLILALAKGIEAKPVSQFVLRRELVIPNNYSARPAYTGVNEVISTDNLVAGNDPGASTIPETIKFEMPDGYWLKRTPTVIQEGDRWRVTQEWWHADSYDTFVFDEFGGG